MGTPLPPGWRSAIDPKQNRDYYFDQSGNVQWTDAPPLPPHRLQLRCRSRFSRSCQPYQ